MHGIFILDKAWDMVQNECVVKLLIWVYKMNFWVYLKVKKSSHTHSTGPAEKTWYSHGQDQLVVICV